MLDCIVVGGGPAGLTAATYLGRFKRRVVVIDADQSRLKRIPRTRNAPGFPGGVTGTDLYWRMHDQAAIYGALFIEGEATSLASIGSGFRIESNKADYLAKTVIIATGVAVTEPHMHSLDRAVAAGVVRYCPICDGFEAQGRRIAILGGDAGALAEAHFLRTYAEDVTFLRASDNVGLSDRQILAAMAAGVIIESSPVVGVRLSGNGVAFSLADGREPEFDVVYPCLGSQPRTTLVAGFGVATGEGGGLRTNRHQETSTPGIFAAGDVVEGLDQIAVACGQAAIAATAVHNRLNA